MIINNNIPAMNTYRQMGANQMAGQKAMEKLSSGMRINKAGDDATGLSISEKMRAQIRGLDQAARNAQDGISLIQTAEGALNETHSILQRMRELAVQAANDTNTTEDLDAIQDELTALSSEITGIAERTEFNTKTLMTGDFAEAAAGEGEGEAAAVRSLNFQIGANQRQTVTLNISDMRASALGNVSAAGEGEGEGSGGLTINNINVTTAVHQSAGAGEGEGEGEGGGAVTFDNIIGSIDKAIEQVSSERSKLGALQNRLDHSINNLNTSAENLQAAESRIRDVDMAREVMEMTKNNILSQASQAMLAQANQAPQAVLQLLG
ncbi:flagellin Hag [Halalkalibacter krulwichiae]|uniref:Flagellin n=1 Tax=Halalkalibacter krulwichiae TaxID=199441 RepID=A0A1X9MIH4_9BACI|nr:flagellin Hag [Halalkalibacter krulwichiae]ARK32093.1 Flagellin [Halalkalibacter krulwichiae]